MSRLLKYVQKFINKSDIFRQVLESQQAEIDILNGNLQDLVNNLFIESATWGLIFFERKYGIKTDLTDTLENRRARVLAKKRSCVTCTINAMKTMALSFSCGDIDIDPHYEEDYFTIKFVSMLGIPPKIQDFYDAIEEIKPAHLEVIYKFTYNTYDDIKTHKWTYDELKKFTNEEIRSSSEIKAKEG